MRNNFETFEADLPQKRRSLLPWWIIGFSWLFMVFGGIAIIITLLSFGSITVTINEGSISLYGLETTEVYSFIGVFILFLFILKGLTGFGLFFEKDWGALMAKIDAIIGIIVCIVVMGYAIYYYSTFMLRLELAFLIPYLLKISKIEKQWNAFKS